MADSGRLQTGLIAGGIGAILLVISSLAGIFWLIFSFFGGVILALIAGYFAGTRVGGNPAFAGRSIGAGALAGLVAGATILVGQIISGIVAAHQSGTLAQFQQTLGQQPGSTSSINTASITLAFAFIGACFGLLDIAMAAALGAAGGFMAARKHRPAPSPAVPDLPQSDYPPRTPHRLGPNIIQPPPRQPHAPSHG